MNVLTFDIEDWFHIYFEKGYNVDEVLDKYESRIRRNMDLIHSALDENNQKATFFCLGWVARKYPDVIRQIVDKGHEIGTHSDNHDLAFLQGKKEFTLDFRRSIASLEDVCGCKVKYYRAPAFSIKDENKWIFEEMINQGIEIDCSIFPAKRDFGGFENFKSGEPCIVDYQGMTIKELPMNVEKILGRPVIFSGGGYFRLFPYWLISSLIKRSKYTMTYFHPRDFDTTQPMLHQLSTMRKFKSYYGLKGSYNKFKRMLNDFEFYDVQQANELIDWDQVSVIKI